MRIAVVHSKCSPPDVSGDQLTVNALTAAGHQASSVVWHELQRDHVDVVLLGAVWDYVPRVQEFTAWLSDVDDHVQVLNPWHVVQWNIRKTYLLELHAAGVPTVDLFVLPTWDVGNVVALAGARGWGELVVKSVVSASGVQMARVCLGDVADQSARIHTTLGEHAIMVQPYLSQFAEHGELSCVFYPDGYSHAVFKKPAAGDYRVQAEYGGTHEPITASADALEVAQAALACAPSGWVYARVDLVNVASQWLIVEVELVEPELFHHVAPDSAARLAAAVTQSVQQHEPVLPPTSSP